MVDAVGSYSGITFHPQTNELWAASRSFTPPNKDAVFKVNLSTGDTTIIGHTGLNKLTNDLLFDDGLNLYGVIGSASEMNDFISVNVSTGVGTIIGAIGMKNILGLAYIETTPTSVEDTKNGNLPNEYTLFQNYPNPFNPTTRIKFSIPASSLNPFSKGEGTFVTLIVYDMLGKEVAKLINEELSAGTYEVEFNASQLSSGIYFYQLKAGQYVQTRKMVLIR